MAKIIEAKAVITAEDRTGSVFDKIAKKIDSIAKTGKTAKAVDDVAKAVERAKTQLSAINKFDMSRGGLAQARTRFNETKTAVESAARAMASTAAPTREMEANFRRTQAAVSNAAKAFERQKDVAILHKRALEGMGINVSEAAQHQTRLHRALDRTNAAMSRQASVTQRNARLWDHNGALGAGAGLAAGAVSAHAIGGGIKRTVLSGAHYQHEATQLENMGRTPEEMKRIEAASKATSSRLPTASYTENLKVLSETTGAFGSLEHAIENLDFMQKANSVVHSAAGDKVHEGPGEMGNKMARFFEMRGTAGDPHVFQSEAEKMVRAMVFTRGNFNPSEMINFGQQAKGALQNYDMSFLGSVAPSLVTEMGGDRAGTGANAWRNTLMGKVRDQKQTAEWVRLGLIDPAMVAGGKGGAPQSWRAGAVKNTDTALRNPLEWTEKTLIPALQKAGTNVDDPLDLSKALGTMFRNQNANQFAEQITQLRARSRLHKDSELMDKVRPMDDMYQNSLKTDPTAAITALTASLDSLATSVSSPAMQAAAGYISSLAGGLQTLAGAMKDHPVLAVSAGVGAAGAGLAGAGFMSYKLMTGFGLSTSAVALDGSAAALSAAAAELAAVGAVGKAGSAAAAAAGGAGAAGAGGGLWAAGTAALPFAAVGAAVAGSLGVLRLSTQDAGYDGMTSGRRMAIQRGGSMRDARRRAWGYDGVSAPEISPTMTYGTGSPGDRGPVTATLTGSAEVKGEAKLAIDINAGSSLLDVVRRAEAAIRIAGTLNTNGPGSTGRSSPDAAAPAVGSSNPSGGHH